jgi:hypothetical protein
LKASVIEIHFIEINNTKSHQAHMSPCCK